MLLSAAARPLLETLSRVICSDRFCTCVGDDGWCFTAQGTIEKHYFVHVTLTDTQDISWSRYDCLIKRVSYSSFVLFCFSVQYSSTFPAAYVRVFYSWAKTRKLIAVRVICDVKTSNFHTVTEIKSAHQSQHLLKQNINLILTAGRGCCSEPLFGKPTTTSLAAAEHK